MFNYGALATEVEVEIESTKIAFMFFGCLHPANLKWTKETYFALFLMKMSEFRNIYPKFLKKKLNKNSRQRFFVFKSKIHSTFFKKN